MPGARVLLGALLLALSAASPVLADESNDASLETLRDTLRSNRKAFVAVNLGLSEVQARSFWPVYDEYQDHLGPLQVRLLRVIEDYTAEFEKLTDEKAMELVEEYLAIERERAQVRSAFLAPFSEALPGHMVMRFYQIENKIDAVLRYELARTIPVVKP